MCELPLPFHTLAMLRLTCIHVYEQAVEFEIPIDGYHIITPRACARGKAIGLCVVVAHTKITCLDDLDA